MKASRALPPMRRWVAVGALSAGAIGAVAGLVVGLMVHPATAWFATFELGVPASLLGAFVGLASAATVFAVQWTLRNARTCHFASNRWR